MTEPLPNSRPWPLGVHVRGDGVNVAVYAGRATKVEFCLIDPDPNAALHPNLITERRFDLEGPVNGVWHAYVPDVREGQEYGFRVHGAWDPVRGQRHNRHKLLLDPYARAIRPAARLAPEHFGHVVGHDFQGDSYLRDSRDSAPYAPRGIVTSAAPHATGPRPQTPWADTILYELHVGTFTAQLPGVPEPLRGTYAGLAHPATIDYLVSLGITAVELLPVQAYFSEPHLTARGKVNTWGYSTLGFFAPHPGYSAAVKASAAVNDTFEPKGTSSGRTASAEALAAVNAEFAAMVAALHEAGIEVILDVVYNHTCEGGNAGPTLSWRGLDSATYYRDLHDGSLEDVTGCGNSLDVRQQPTIRMIMDSLRYWVEVMGVDGFRFDLATTLGRTSAGFDRDQALLMAIKTDPALDGVKLIAEPWDVGMGGWRTGDFGAPWVEWNDRFRDDVRNFWLGAGVNEFRYSCADIATRMAGSQDLFPHDRGPLASVSFITAHDGFTLADLCSYERKHNDANGEENRDGTDNNRSANHGAEGPTQDEGIQLRREQSIRNMLGTLLMSTGVPMITAGDEFGRTQNGNNNLYCRDHDTPDWAPATAVDWQLQPWQRDLLATTKYLIQLRKKHPSLPVEEFFTGQPLGDDEGTIDLAWFDDQGQPMTREKWQDDRHRVLQAFVYAKDLSDRKGWEHTNGILLIMNSSPNGASEQLLRLPGSPWADSYHLVWNSAHEVPRPSPEEIDPRADQLVSRGPSMQVLAALRKPRRGRHEVAETTELEDHQEFFDEDRAEDAFFERAAHTASAQETSFLNPIREGGDETSFLAPIKDEGNPFFEGQTTWQPRVRPNNE